MASLYLLRLKLHWRCRLCLSMVNTNEVLEWVKCGKAATCPWRQKQETETDGASAMWPQAYTGVGMANINAWRTGPTWLCPGPWAHQSGTACFRQSSKDTRIVTNDKERGYCGPRIKMKIKPGADVDRLSFLLVEMPNVAFLENNMDIFQNKNCKLSFLTIQQYHS